MANGDMPRPTTGEAAGTIIGLGALAIFMIVIVSCTGVFFDWARPQRPINVTIRHGKAKDGADDWGATPPKGSRREIDIREVKTESDFRKWRRDMAKPID